MKTINLLPRKPFVERAFKLLFAAVVMLSAAICAAILTLDTDYSSDTRAIEAEIRRMEARIAELAGERKPDPLFSDFAAYRNLVNNLERARRDWEPVLAAITGALPSDARVTSMATGEDGKLTMAADFREWNEIAEYAVRLQATEPVEEVAVRSIVRENRQVLVPPGPPNAAQGPQTARLYSAVLELTLAENSSMTRETDQ
jgi:hypothetical protein